MSNSEGVCEITDLEASIQVIPQADSSIVTSNEIVSVNTIGKYFKSSHGSHAGCSILVTSAGRGMDSRLTMSSSSSSSSISQPSTNMGRVKASGCSRSVNSIVTASGNGSGGVFAPLAHSESESDLDSGSEVESVGDVADDSDAENDL